MRFLLVLFFCCFFQMGCERPFELDLNIEIPLSTDSEDISGDTNTSDSSDETIDSGVDETDSNVSPQ